MLTDNQKQAAELFSKDRAVDPVLLCDSCVEAVLTEDINKSGGCPYCGNKKVRSALVLSDKNQAKVRNWIEEGKVDPLFMDLFKDSQTHNTINQDGVI